MKYIVLGFEGFIFSVAHHLQKEGCEVFSAQVIDGAKTSVASDFIEDEEEKKLRLSTYDNVIEKFSIDVLIKKLKKISDPKNYFVICESNNLFHYASYLQSLGFEGNFPTRENRLFEVDRNLSKKFVKKYYPLLKVAENKSFHSVKSATTFLQKSKKVWVLKSQTDNLATLVPKTDSPSQANTQLVEQLLVYKDVYESSGFLLEEKISSVIEITPEKIYYDGVPLGMTVMFENKGIGSGNISYQVGCAGDLVFPVNIESKIHDICFPPIVDKLAKRHKGLFIWDASLLIDSVSGDIYFGEFCPNRLGFNSFLTTLEQMPSIHSYFEHVVQKKNPFHLGTVGVSVTLFNLLRDPQTNRILKDTVIDFPEGNAKHIWPYEIYKKAIEGNYYANGYDISISPITATGKTMSHAVERLYTYVEKFQMNNVYYRPKFDFLSHDYPTSIPNRLAYCIDRKLFTLPFQL